MQIENACVMITLLFVSLRNGCRSEKACQAGNTGPKRTTNSIYGGKPGTNIEKIQRELHLCRPGSTMDRIGDRLTQYSPPKPV